ncbi:glycosyltransferase [Rhodoplanes serenus]|uniref:glycosyltransferase n=1 Tax=Rhodoplanes serenus TaxID=200615 RepID=UPI000DADB0A1|nr:glycosyltransferase [Rhodoplanes serenus]RAI37017.1 hypothetical protein CH340_01205 [Rhodoplanes serenus]
MASRIYYWIHHTGRYEANSGVQRVVRSLAAALARSGRDLVPVRWCPQRETIVRAERAWLDGLARFGGPRLPDTAEPGEPIHLGAEDRDHLEGGWLLVPEVPHVGSDTAPVLPVVLDYARYYGLRIAAVFYDLLPLTSAGYESLRAAHTTYAHCLAGADVVFPISEFVGRVITEWWAEHDYIAPRLPRIHPILLPAELVGQPRVRQVEAMPERPIRFLSIGTVEPRKNQVALLRAFSDLVQRRRDLDLRIDLVGSVHAAVAEEVAAACASNSRITIHGACSEDVLLGLLRQCHATVFVSLEEGYGLPIAESLWLGKPVVCSGFGSMYEIAASGGCLLVNSRDTSAIESALEQIADKPELRLRLATEAVTRPLEVWSDYVGELLAVLDSCRPSQDLLRLEGSRADPGTGRVDSPRPAARRLSWRREIDALVPRNGAGVMRAASAIGCLPGTWALLSFASTADAGEAVTIVDHARALGLRVAVEFETSLLSRARVPEVVAAADLSLFESDATRADVLAQALRELPRTTTVRHRLRVGVGDAAPAVVASERPRLVETRRNPLTERVYYWVGLTASQPFNTGIQRVVRQLGAALERLGVEVVPVKWDAAAGRMTGLSTEEAAHLSRWRGPVRGSTDDLPEDLTGEWLFVPEITVPMVPPGSNPARIAHAFGMRAATIFYDLIPFKMRDDFPREFVTILIEYWNSLSEFDLVLPISWTTSADFVRYLSTKRLRRPRIVPCPLAGEIPGVARARRERPVPRDPREPLALLAVGTLEPRKNYVRLFRALGRARDLSARPIELSIAGRRGVFPDLDAELDALATTLGGVHFLGNISDEELMRWMGDVDLSVYASWEEGFGLPVLESLWHGLPCLCHDGSSLAEVAPGGGTVMVDMLDEEAIAQAIARFANDPASVDALTAEAERREIRTWDEYARDVCGALATVSAPIGWPLPAIAKRRPLLSCSITTYNRARWLAVGLPRLLELTRPWRDVVEVVVCDNASTDDTPDVVNRFRSEGNFRSRRNRANVGMLGNLGVTARESSGAFVWLLGDDDLLIDGAIENVLEGIVRHPDVEMVYMNYSYTNFDSPEQLVNANAVIEAARPIAAGGPNRRVDALREVAALNENLFTAIYACAFRRDHALRAYQQDTRGDPFSSLATCVPSSTYALAALQERPAWWIGDPAIVVNMNVSWLRWALLWHLERMPDLFDMAERAGIDPIRIDRYRYSHCTNAGEWADAAYFKAEDAIRTGLSMARLIERCKHLAEFRSSQVPILKDVYRRAWAAGRVVDDEVPPDLLFRQYGL